jgi:hypothetical protein
MRAAEIKSVGDNGVTNAERAARGPERGGTHQLLLFVYHLQGQTRDPTARRTTCVAIVSRPVVAFLVALLIRSSEIAELLSAKSISLRI